MPDSTSQALKHLPADTQTLVSLDLKKLRSQEEWPSLMNALLGPASSASLARFESLCGFSFAENIESIRYASRKNGHHIIDVSGLTRSLLDGCLAKMPQRKLSADGAISRLQNGDQTNVFLWLGENRFLFSNAPAPEDELVAISEQSEVSLPVTFLKLLKEVDTTSDAWVAIRGSHEVLDKLSATKQKARAALFLELRLGEVSKFNGAIATSSNEDAKAAYGALENVLADLRSRDDGVEKLADLITLTQHGNNVRFMGDLDRANLGLAIKALLPSQVNE